MYNRSQISAPVGLSSLDEALPSPEMGLGLFQQQDWKVINKEPGFVFVLQCRR